MALKGGFTRGRRWVGAGEGLLAALVVALLVFAVTYAATRPSFRVRVDLTENDEYTLSEQTRQVLESLDRPVTFTAIMKPEVSMVIGLSEAQARAAEYVTSLLDEYALASGGTVTVRALNPDRDRARVDPLVREHHLTRYNLVLVSAGDRTEQVFLEEMVTIDRGLADPERLRPAELVDLRGEGPLTSALLSVSSDVRPRVDFVVGHGEPRIDDLAGEGGIGLFAEALRGQGLDPRVLELYATRAVPRETDVVVVVAPRKSFDEAEIEALAAFHEDGGALLLLVEPALGPFGDGLDPLLGRLGLLREPTRLCTQDERVDPQVRAWLTIRRFLDHPITAPIHRQGTFARLLEVCALAKDPAAPAGRPWRTLALTDETVFGDLPGPDGIGDFTLGDREQVGPRTVAFALDEGPRGRVVVVGSASFVLNGLFGTTSGGPAGVDLALNAANWLAQREDAVAARPRTVFESRVDLFEDELGRIRGYVMAWMPLGAVALGLLVWFLRRR